MSPRWVSAEACPRCYTRPLYPAAWEEAPGGLGYATAYRCPRCGHVWPVYWHRSVLSEDEPRRRRDAV